MKKTYIIAIVLIAIAIGVIFSSVADSSTYADFDTATKNMGKEYHVVGKLNKDKALEYNPQIDVNLFSFYLIDNNGKEMRVVYHNTKPQDFEKSEQIVVVGKIADNCFEAENILMKCPSKYNNAEQIGQAKM